MFVSRVEQIVYTVARMEVFLLYSSKSKQLQTL